MVGNFIWDLYLGLVRVTVELVVVLVELVTVPLVLCAMAGMARPSDTINKIQSDVFLLMGSL